MCQIKDCSICNAGQEFLKEEVKNQNEKDSVQYPPVSPKMTSDQEKDSVQHPPLCTKVNSDQEKHSVQNLPQCTNGTSDQEEYSAQNPKVNSPWSPPGNPPLCTRVTSGQSHFSNSLARKDGITPLIMAAAMNHDLCVDLLLSAGVDPNEESKVGCLNLFLGSAAAAVFTLKPLNIVILLYVVQ